MDRIKTRQQKFKKGKEKMLSLVQESGDGQNLVPPTEEDDDDGMMQAELGRDTCGLIKRMGLAGLSEYHRPKEMSLDWVSYMKGFIYVL